MAESVGFAGARLGTLERSQEVLASGRRVRRVASDPAALAIGEQHAAAAATLRTARRNVDVGEASLRIADSGLRQQQDLLVRARELAVQAGNGLLADRERAALHDEFGAVVDEIDRIGTTTRYGDIDLLQGSDVSVQVGTGGDIGDRITAAVGASTADSLQGTDPETGAEVSLRDLDITTEAAAQRAAAVVSGAFSQVGQNRAGVGASITRLETADDTITSMIEGTAAAGSRLVDIEVAAAASQGQSAEIRLRAELRAEAVRRQEERGTKVNLIV